MDAFIGMIMPFAGNFAPVGWALCNGQPLSIQQNTALFAIIGTFYGGDGRSTFNLPNLNGRAIVGAGQLQGGGNYQLGQSGGAESVTLSTNQLPAHSHTLESATGTATGNNPAGSLLARNNQTTIYAPPSGGTSPMAGAAISSVGGGQPVPTTTPYQAVTYIICTQGLFPSRS